MISLIQLEELINFNHPESNSIDNNPSAVRALIDSYKIHNHEHVQITAVSKIFLSEESTNLKPSSFRRKQKHIDQFIKWSGNRGISKITKKITGDYVSSIISKKNPAYDTLRNIVADISSLFSWAEGRGYLDRNPFYKLRLPRAKKVHKRDDPGLMKKLCCSLDLVRLVKMSSRQQ